MAGYKSIDVRRDAERFTTEREGITTRHLLSFGDHYDAARTSIGPIVAHNDETLDPGCGYTAHRHRGVEIVTWVVAGRLMHRDDTGGESVLDPGGVQALSAGSGVVHEERAQSVRTRFVQIWLGSDDASAPPRHGAAQIEDDDLRARLVPIASGKESSPSTAPLPLRSADAVCYAGRLAAGDRRPLPAAPLVHVFVVSGALAIANVVLDGGDSATLAVTTAAECVAVSNAELLVWAVGVGRRAQVRGSGQGR